jgi:hypothetical protein
MDSKHKIFTNSVTTKGPHSPSFTRTPTIISLVVILLSLGTVQPQKKYTQIPSSSHSPTLTTSLQPSMIKQKMARQFTVMQVMDQYLEVDSVILSYTDSNQNKSSGTYFPTSFVDTTGYGKNTFTGEESFTTNEIEVYLVRDN